jgi:hypothetical protein
LFEGSECPEGSSQVALELVRSKLEHEVRPSRGNAAPQIELDGKLRAEGTRNCRYFVEEQREIRVMAKTGDLLSEGRVLIGV